MINLKNGVSPKEDDQVWQEWAESNSVIFLKDLIETKGIRISLKKRALLHLLVPYQEFHSVKLDKDFFCNYHINLSCQPWDLNNFFGILEQYELIEYFTDIIIEMFPILQNAKKEQYVPVLYFYNNCILHLLKKLPREKSENLFSVFSLLDISSWSVMDEVSGYGGFKQTLLDQEIDIYWKIKADLWMQKIIVDEFIGKAEPRAKWENALRCYVSILINFYGKLYSFDEELFLQQFNFLFNKKFYGKLNINPISLPIIFNKIKEKKNRWKFVQFIFFHNLSDFVIYDYNVLELSKKIISEFGKKDEKITKYLNSSIQKYEAEKKKLQKKSKIQEKESIKKEAEILKKMK